MVVSIGSWTVRLFGCWPAVFATASLTNRLTITQILLVVTAWVAAWVATFAVAIIVELVAWAFSFAGASFLQP